MKKFAFAICLLFASTICAHAKTPPNPADYPIPVHVTGSHLRGYDQYLDVIIDGQRYELRGTDVRFSWLFRPGDYKARIITDQKSLYDFNRAYEFLLPDNKTREFKVIGIPDPTLPPSTL